MENVYREIKEETFDKNDILNIKLEADKISDTVIRDTWGWFALIIFLSVFAVLFIWLLKTNINWNREHFDKYGEVGDYSLFWPTVGALVFIGLSAFVSVVWWKRRQWYISEFEEVKSRVNKINSYDDYIDYKEWIVEEKMHLIRAFNRIMKWRRSNGFTKGLIVGGLIL